MADIFTSGGFLTTAAIIIALVVSGITAFLIMPPLIKKMRERGVVGLDWNKKEKTEIPELGGIAVLFAFPIGIAIASGVLKLFDSFNSISILAAISVLFIAGVIGILDGISDIPQRAKAVMVAFAALPLLLAASGKAYIDLPFGAALDFTGSRELFLLYWIVIVPIAVTGAANAMNMSAGYNGLESGQIIVISLALLASAFYARSSVECILIFAALFGASVGLNYYNGYPAVVFVGDVGTLSMGAVIAAGVIIGNLQLPGLIAIAPAFYELFSTAYYSLVKKVNRKTACQKPIIDDDGRLHPPKGAERYTLAFWLLSKKPMTEKNLVRIILGIYAVFGVLAVLVTIL